ncbi:hypothetical protein F511_20927 [Dorcoceras hygrometricum]|uniref:Uncharacterized protein n=1 Tax=Dorcoceras hygrometricum TaxID=472368 RepID=A0A2Z7BLL8_9LAMI|nr:hypothetical protein F511_20927 [Dorcoceras hygrometricum]
MALVLERFEHREVDQAARRRRTAAPPRAQWRACDRALASFKSRAGQLQVARWPRDGQTLASSPCASCCVQVGAVRHAWRTVVARSCRAWRGGVRPSAARYVGGGRRPAILVAMRRLVYLLGFVRACPGKPMKFSGQYSILGQFLSI